MFVDQTADAGLFSDVALAEIDRVPAGRRDVAEHGPDPGDLAELSLLNSFAALPPQERSAWLDWMASTGQD
jgi:hypothetical protein